jgi:hypothetical protein
MLDHIGDRKWPQHTHNAGARGEPLDSLGRSGRRQLAVRIDFNCARGTNERTHGANARHIEYAAKRDRHTKRRKRLLECRSENAFESIRSAHGFSEHKSGPERRRLSGGTAAEVRLESAAGESVHIETIE